MAIYLIGWRRTERYKVKRVTRCLKDRVFRNKYIWVDKFRYVIWGMPQRPSEHRENTPEMISLRKIHRKNLRDNCRNENIHQMSKITAINTKDIMRNNRLSKQAKMQKLKERIAQRRSLRQWKFRRTIGGIRKNGHSLPRNK